MTEKKPIESILVTYEEFSEWEFQPPGSYFCRVASGDYYFYKTSSRQKAQEQIDIDFPPKGKYSAIPVKTSKTKSKLENGGYSCTGTQNRRK